MSALPSPIVDALQFEQATWSNGTAADDSFYTAPDDSAKAPPGTLLKIEKDVDTTRYLLPSATAISRIMYQSETTNGSRVPVSAYILWPYSPRSQPDGYSIVAWAHGTSGTTVSSAPSSHKRIRQHFLAPYQLLLQGYVVVATDYAGLGVGKNASGEPIVHEYLACPSHANDVIYSLQAARVAFPELSEKFVAIGHSQGGGAAWAVAQRQADNPTPGYLGSIAISPVTRVIDEPGEFLPVLVAAICPGLANAFPDFDPKDVLTPECEDRLKIIEQKGAGVSSGIALLLGGDLLKPNWRQNPHLQHYQSLTSNGGKAIGGPLLVIQGESDPQISLSVTTSAVEKTTDSFPSAQLEYVTIPNVTHDPALPASQWLWMDWIVDRFAGREVMTSSQRSILRSARPITSYQAEQNWYLEPATQFYHTP